MTISQKLYSGFSAVLFLLVIIMCVNYYGIEKLNSTYRQLLDERAKVVNLVKDLNILI